MRRRTAWVALIAIQFIWMFPTDARGQTADPRFEVRGVFSGVWGPEDATGGAALGLRMHVWRSLGVEAEVSRVADLGFGEFPVCPPGLFCVRGGTFTLDRTISAFTGAVVARIPTRIRWVQPSVSAGAGVARIRRDINDPLFPSSSTATSPAVLVGGALDVPVRHNVALGIDVRYTRAVRERPRVREFPLIPPDIPDRFSWTRVGGSVSVRF